MRSLTSTLSSLARGAALALAPTLVACGGPTVGELAAQEVTLTVTGIASAPDVASIGEPQGGLGVSRAFLSTIALRFEPCDAGAADVSLAPRAYDLLSEPAPSETITTAVQALCGLRVDIGRATSSVDGVPDDATLYVEGTLDDGEPFSSASEATSTLRFEAGSSGSFGDQPLLLGVDVSSWLADRTASSDPLSEGLVGAAALYIDANGNGELDDDEQEPRLASAP
ncbi:MAG TPA: hypothetical protein VEQ59_13565 [Polyangiaceae bacterium]|nr:hypothetical protein [Polyangiaceae bacterium]